MIDTSKERVERLAADLYGFANAERRAEAADMLLALKASAEAAEKALREIATECSTFPINNGLAFRCESIARAALEAKP